MEHPLDVLRQRRATRTAGASSTVWICVLWFLAMEHLLYLFREGEPARADVVVLIASTPRAAIVMAKHPLDALGKRGPATVHFSRHLVAAREVTRL
jgi:hypothetical protein